MEYSNNMKYDIITTDLIELPELDENLFKNQFEECVPVFEKDYIDISSVISFGENDWFPKEEKIEENVIVNFDSHQSIGILEEAYTMRDSSNVENAENPKENRDFQA
jgi:hypothetical protein